MRFDVALGSAVTVAVNELDPVIELYTEGLGLGPFEIEEVDAQDATRCDPEGTTASPTRLRIATAPLGPCEMELIEVTSGNPPHAKFLADRGEGMNHFNLDKGTAEGYLDTLSTLYWRGIEPFWGLPFGSFCYVDSESIGGVTFEIMVGSGHAGKKGHNHLGLVVEDTKRTLDFYSEGMGLGPFRTDEYPMARGFYRDQRIETSFRASFCDIGEAKLQLIQVLGGESPISEHLKTQGEGMHHLCLNVPDWEASLADFAQQGIQATWRCPELRTAYLRTEATGGMTFAIAEAH